MFADHSPKLPLNDFQRLILLWQAHQPFSGIDAIEALGAVDPSLLRAAAEAELARVGTGFPIVSSDGKTVTYQSVGPAVSVESIPTLSGASPVNSLAHHCGKELNRPFQRNVDPVIRMWVLQTVPHPHIGMTWQHWPIDGVPAADLFRHILARFAGLPLVDDRGTVDLVESDLAAAFRAHHTWKRRVVYFRENTRETFRASRVFPIPRPRPERTSLQVHLLDLAHPRRPIGATINDVVAAAVISALADAIPERRRRLWRNRINLMNMVDLRPFGDESLQKMWGMFLGYFIFHLPEPRPASFAELVQSICAQSIRIRNGRFFFGSLSSFRAMRIIFPWLPKRLRWSLPPSVAPFTAGLTNTRHRGDWTGDLLGTRFGRSWRVAPLGNTVPLAVDVCTKGDQLSLALTCEDRSFMGDRIGTIKEKLSSLLGPI